jgi:hypothetical protein
LCLELCDQCFDMLRHLGEAVISMHVWPRQRNTSVR